MNATKIETGMTPSGLKTARLGDYRMVKYHVAGYSIQKMLYGDWRILPTGGETAPVEIERALCKALNVECKR